MKREQAERDSAKETTAATVADLGVIQQQISKVKALLYSATGKRPI